MQRQIRSRMVTATIAPLAAAGLALWWHRRRAGKPAPKAAKASLAPDPAFYAFPPDFVWGSATSSYQVEGGIVNDWSAAGMDAGKAVDHYHRYEEDFDQAQAMGHKAHRFSLEWARIEPRPGEWNAAEIAHYRQVLRSLKARGLTPFVTLWHFTQPIWFAERGGWQNEANLDAYVAYVEKVVGELKDEAEIWITLNEPLVYSFQAYDDGRWPPFVRQRDTALWVARNLLLGHARAYHAIKAIQPGAQVGLVKNMTVMDPLYDWHPLSRTLTRLQDQLFNEAIWKALSEGRLDVRLPGCKPVRVDDPALLKGALDFMGINYYTRFFISPTGRMITRKNAPLSDIGWEIYNEGLLRVLTQAAPYADKLGIPIYITENGLADGADAQRKAYLLHHLEAVWRALQAGLPVKGYFHWSLIDNFEWADGYGYHFGLLDAARNWRASAHLYQDVIAKQGFPADWLTEHAL